MVVLILGAVLGAICKLPRRSCGEFGTLLAAKMGIDRGARGELGVLREADEGGESSRDTFSLSVLGGVVGGGVVGGVGCTLTSGRPLES